MVPVHFLLGLLLLAMALYFLMARRDRILFRASILASYLVFAIAIGEQNFLHPYLLIILIAAWLGLGAYFAYLTRQERKKGEGPGTA